MALTTAGSMRAKRVGSLRGSTNTCNVQGSGCRVQGAGFRVQGSGFGFKRAGFRVSGARFKVQSAQFRVQGLRFHLLASGGQVSRSSPSRNILPVALASVKRLWYSRMKGT